MDIKFDLKHSYSSGQFFQLCRNYASATDGCIKPKKKHQKQRRKHQKIQKTIYLVIATVHLWSNWSMQKATKSKTIAWCVAYKIAARLDSCWCFFSFLFCSNRFHTECALHIVTIAIWKEKLHLDIVAYMVRTSNTRTNKCTQQIQNWVHGAHVALLSRLRRKMEKTAEEIKQN